MTRLLVPLNSTEACDAGRFGPKAANQAILGRAGLPIPDGFCLDAEAYRKQVTALNLWDSARGAFGSENSPQMRRCALDMKLGLLDKPIIPEILEPLLEARRQLIDRTGALLCVRSSALVEDRYGSSFAGQFESFIGIESEDDFITAVRSC
ncbi:MAG TPA: PEP/pyruvate-binding domain-containing protein, partial [Burkholderiales bacterium]|nr:PEP/pyruvate-binding domain-containing protein [Burkholderiales bacterium]